MDPTLVFGCTGMTVRSVVGQIDAHGAGQVCFGGRRGTLGVLGGLGRGHLDVLLHLNVGIGVHAGSTSFQGRGRTLVRVGITGHDGSPGDVERRPASGCVVGQRSASLGAGDVPSIAVDGEIGDTARRRGGAGCVVGGDKRAGLQTRRQA